jgi:hypothetical protein
MPSANRLQSDIFFNIFDVVNLIIWKSITKALLKISLSKLYLILSVSEQKELIRMEKDKTRMAEAFLELDDDADG